MKAEEMEHKKVEDMSLRDWFAGMALQALIGAEGLGLGAVNKPDTRIKAAYEYADAMVKKSQKK